MEEQRREFAEAAKLCVNFSALCREYGKTRRTGYKWAERYAADESMTNKSRRPDRSSKKTPTEVEAKILDVRAENPGWGAKTIHCVLERRGDEALPCVKTVNNILKRNGCISPEQSLMHQP